MNVPSPILHRLAAACALVAGACAIAPTHADSAAPSVFTNPPGAGEPQLYARDGSVVDPTPADAQDPGSAARREVGGESGRMYLLELYQQVIDERDGLNREVHALRADLEAQSGALGQSQARVIQLEGELRASQEQVQRLSAESQDLAARLTTAQIRRLQAERLLLEHQLGVQREREAQAATAQSAPEGGKP